MFYCASFDCIADTSVIIIIVKKTFYDAYIPNGRDSKERRTRLINHNQDTGTGDGQHQKVAKATKGTSVTFQ